VKCLVFYHPEDDLELRLQQEARVRELHADCVALERQLLLEVIVTAEGRKCDHTTVANVLRRFYNLGVFPAWWKLESQCPEGWQEITAVIERYDPGCNGVLLLGLDAPESELKTSFQVAAGFEVCKGFAVGRSIFGEVARQWFEGVLKDREAVDLIAANYQKIIHLWQEARPGTGCGKQKSAVH
jgi:5-dehydro-2-deoxygluconokinase